MAIIRQSPSTSSNITINGAQLTQSMGATSSSSISMGGFGNLTPGLSITSLDSLVFWDNPNVKKYEIVETTEDLMALSATWYRIRMSRTPENQGTIFPTTLIDKILFPEVNQDDRKLAADIRDYYSKKIMMWKLKGKELNNFEKDMNEFIHTDGLKFQEKMIPLVYSLPGFYAYALDFDKMMALHDTSIKDAINQVGTKRLDLVKVLDSGRRSRKTKEYWFRDESNHLVKMVIQADNPLMSLLDLYTQDQIIVNGLFTKITRDDKDYFMVSKFKFI